MECETSKGALKIQLRPDWSPLGVDRIMGMLSDSYFDDQLIYRVIPGFLIQFGIGADPQRTRKWWFDHLADEPRKVGFRKGILSFGGSGPDTRCIHLFIALSPDGEK